MFIAIGEKLRKHSRWLFGLFAIATSLSLVGYFTQTAGSTNRAEAELPTIGGKPVAHGEFNRAMVLIREEYAMSGRKLRDTADTRDRIRQEAVLMILQDRKAKEMDIRVSDEELEREIKAQAQLHDENGQFDPRRYAQALKELEERGISAAAFEEIVRVQVTHAKLQTLVTSAAKVTPTEIQQALLPLHEKLTVDIIQFNASDYKEPVVVSNELVKAFYDRNQESFRTPALTKIRYATFGVDDLKKTVTVTDEEISDTYNHNKSQFLGTNNLPQPLEAVKGEIRNELLLVHAQQAAQRQAEEFGVKLAQAGDTKPDFSKIAASLKAPIKETGFFSASDKNIDLEPSVITKAFALAPDLPFSDPIAGTNAYYVLEYVDGKPSVVPPFEEVKDKVTEAVKRLLTYDAILKIAHTDAEMLKKVVANGTKFDKACADLGLHYTTPPSFLIADDTAKLPAAEEIKQIALSLPAGGISDVIRNPPTGGVVFHLRERRPADLNEFEKHKAEFSAEILRRNRQGLYNDWLQALVRSEQVDFKYKKRPAATEESEEASPVQAAN